jgi:plasmid stabilization system protein ParE
VTYTVRWNRRSLETVATLWLENPAQRAEISQAAESVDQRLASRPHDQGESRDEDERIMFAQPLVVIFTIDEAAELVRVVKVRHLKRRGTAQ